jgi:hypothetical protein
MSNYESDVLYYWAGSGLTDLQMMDIDIEAGTDPSHVNEPLKLGSGAKLIFLDVASKWVSPVMCYKY